MSVLPYIYIYIYHPFSHYTYLYSSQIQVRLLLSVEIQKGPPHPYILYIHTFYLPQALHQYPWLPLPSFATWSTSFMFVTFSQLVVVLAGRYGHQCLCCDCLPEICINKLPVPACPRCCPGARTFAYRAVIGLPWVPSATAERVGGRQHHKWVLNWNLTAALHFMCGGTEQGREWPEREKEVIKREWGNW